MDGQEQGDVTTGKTGEFLNKALEHVAGDMSDRLTNRIRQIEEEKQKRAEKRSASSITVAIKVDTSEILKLLDATERHLDIVFDGDPFGPRVPSEAGQFVEVESPAGTGVKAGTWIDRGDGFWALRLTLEDFLSIGQPTENVRTGKMGGETHFRDEDAGLAVVLTTREFCQRCHSVSAVGFFSPHEIWRKVAGPHWAYSILCVRCFASLGDEKHIKWEEGIQFHPVSYATHHEGRKGSAQEPAEVRSKYPCPQCGISTTPIHRDSPFMYYCSNCQKESGVREWLGKSYSTRFDEGQMSIGKAEQK